MSYSAWGRSWLLSWLASWGGTEDDLPRSPVGGGRARARIRPPAVLKPRPFRPSIPVLLPTQRVDDDEALLLCGVL
jgi:hypothetical protein